MNEHVRHEDEIDLVALFLKLKSKWYSLVIGILVGAILLTSYGTFIATPMYRSKADLYLRSKSQVLSLQELNISTVLSKDYEVIFRSRPNIEAVIDELNLSFSVEQVNRMISVQSLENTRIIRITCTTPNPSLSKNIANSIMDHGMDIIREIDSQEPYVIERAISSNVNVGRSVRTYTMMGAMAGFVVVAGIYTVMFVMNDNVNSASDLEDVLGIPVLARITENNSLKYTKKKSKSKKHE